MTRGPAITDWFLDAAERGNPASVVDDRHPGTQAWSVGNLVEPLVHGATYFAALSAAVRRMRRGDLLMFVDWRGDPDQRLGRGSTVELWSADIGRRIESALRERPGLHVVTVLPHHPDQDGRISRPPNPLGRHLSLSRIRAAAPERVAVFGVENHAGTPVYVHAKVCVIDDRRASVGSDNLNRRSWTHDSELAAAVWDTTPTDDGHSVYARHLRQQLMGEHLDRATTATDAAVVFAELTSSAATPQRWHDDGAGPRPPGRLRPLADPPLSVLTRAWSQPLYRTVYDPDARRPLDRLRRRY